MKSRPGAGADDRPAGSIAPGGWRNSDSYSDGGVESRHAGPKLGTSERQAKASPHAGRAGMPERTSGRAEKHQQAGVAPGPSETHSVPERSSRAPVHYGAPMRRILSWPVLGQRPKPANDHYNSEPDEERHDRQPRPCDAWQLHLHPPLRSPLESLSAIHPVLKRRDLTQPTFEKPALLFALLFIFSVPAFLIGFVAFLLFV